MTLVISFHQSSYRTLKDYFLRYVTPYLRWVFPLVGLMPQAFVPLCAYLQTRKGQSQGVAFIDSTLLAICHPKRAPRHQVFVGLAFWGRNSLVWYHGFKLYLLINDVRELPACRLTAANVNDWVPVPALVARRNGKGFGDRALFPTCSLLTSSRTVSI